MIRLVGIGPGSADLLTPGARDALVNSDVILGYEFYLELLEDVLESDVVRYQNYSIGEEMKRARDTVKFAREGKRTALVSGGDAGIYGMGSPLFEVLDGQDDDEIEVEVFPGITALSAASSRLGAPVGQDFATISLSDLLTPRERIKERVRCAAEGDFVIVFYNPRSSNRPEPLPEALDIIRNHRSPDTPVGLVWNAWRTGEVSETTRLDSVPVEDVNMAATVVVGNSRTREHHGWIYTPRGYGPNETNGH